MPVSPKLILLNKYLLAVITNGRINESASSKAKHPPARSILAAGAGDVSPLVILQRVLIYCIVPTVTGNAPFFVTYLAFCKA